LGEHGRLGKEKLLRRARVGEMARNGFEDFKLSEADMHEFILVNSHTKFNSVLFIVEFTHTARHPERFG
jgi:hypothetical protein